MRKITKREQQIINKLHKMDDNWPDTLELFADNGSLTVIDPVTKEVLDDLFVYIMCDGGDPDRSYDEDGTQFLNSDHELDG